jgi:hypothetical protein
MMNQDNKGETIFRREKDRKSIKKHKRERRQLESMAK